MVTAFRNNVAYHVRLRRGGCPPARDCAATLGVSDAEGFQVTPPNRAQYLDYNDYEFDPATTMRMTYDIGVAGKTLCQPGWGGHDLGTCPNASVDPRFRGPLPVGTGQIGAASPDNSGFPFNDADILSGTYPVSQMLAYFRWVYAPAAGSPLVGAQDPQDGSGDIGAVQVGTLPPSPPAIVGTNKRPMVYAGPSFAIANAGVPAKLSGYAADDALPSGTLTVQWTKVSGPGSVTFDAPDHAIANASFSATGTYVLRLTARDGQLESTSDTQISVGTGVASASSSLPEPPSNVHILK